MNYNMCFLWYHKESVCYLWYHKEADLNTESGFSDSNDMCSLWDHKESVCSLWYHKESATLNLDFLT